MPRFAANLSMLFTEVPFLDRFALAAKAGFTAVEFLFPYAFSAPDIKDRLDAHGLKLVLHNLPAGDWEAAAVRQQVTLLRRADAVARTGRDPGDAALGIAPATLTGSPRSGA